MGLLPPANATEWLTLLLVIITGLYALATFHILKANRATVQAVQEQTEALLRPYVSVEVTTRPGTTLVHLVVRNSGKSSAEGLRMAIDRPVLEHGGGPRGNLQDLPLFAGEHRMALAAGAELFFILGMGHKLFDRSGPVSIPEQFVVSAEYSFGHRNYKEDHTIDVRPLLHSSVKHHQVATAVEQVGEKLTKAIKELRSDLRQHLTSDKPE